MNDISIEVLTRCTADFLWVYFQLLTKSPFYLELRDKYLISLLCQRWDVGIQDDMVRFLLQFDKKYFLSSYTDYEYRKSRLTIGFGYTRLFKYCVVNGVKLNSEFRDFTWLSNYLIKHSYNDVNYIYSDNIGDTIKKAVKKKRVK